MKKRLLVIICVLALMVSAAVGLTAFAADTAANALSEGSWTVDEATTEAASGAFTQKTIGTATSAVYSEKFNLNTDGANIEFDINQFDVDPQKSDVNIMTFTFKNEAGYGLRLEAHLRYTDRATIRGKIRWVLVRLDPTLEADPVKNYPAGERVFGDLFSCRRIFGSSHRVDVQRLFDNFVITVDDSTFVPDFSMKKFDLSNCTLTVTANSTANTAAKYTVSKVNTEVSDLIDGDWMDLGTSDLSFNDDGTMCYTNIDEEFSADNTDFGGEALMLRNIITNVSGYSVDERIDISIHYDTSATPAVWWATLFAATPFNHVKATGYDIHELNGNKGIMFQTTTGLAEAFFSNKDADKKPYADNGGGKGYAGESMLNVISLEIGEETSTVYWNNKPLFENYPMKKSDFKSGKVYPYFRFIESPPVATKTNTITIRGVNTPAVAEKDKTQKRLLSETKDQVIPVDGRGNGEVTFCMPDRTPVSKELYSYNAENKTLTVKPQVFASITENCTRTYLIGNKGGYQSVKFIFADEFAALAAPVITPEKYSMKAGSLTEDLTIKADLKNGVWDGFRGSFLSTSNYSYTIDDNNVATIVIFKDFVNDLQIGERNFTLKTKSVDGTEEQSTVFTVLVHDGTGEGDEGENSTNIGCGCGSETAAASAAGAAAVLFVATAIVLFKRKAKN